MKKGAAILLFLALLAIPFSAYLLRPDLIGNDGYGFLLFVCRENNLIGLDGLSFLAFSAIPCSIIAIKALLFGLAAITGCVIIEFAWLFSPKNGWLAAYLLFLTSVFVMEFTIFENDQLAYPLLFCSLLLFFRGIRCEKWKRTNFALCLLCLGIGTLLWNGGVFFLVAYSLTIWLFLIASIPLLLWKGKELFGLVVFGNNLISENQPFQFHMHYLLNFGIMGLLFEPLLLYQGLFFYTLGMAADKFWVLSVPFLIVGMIIGLEKADKEWLNHIVMIVSFITVFGLAQSVWLNPPTQAHWQAIDYAIEAADGNRIGNDWGMGYWVLWAGGDTNSYMSPERQEAFSPGEITVSGQDLNCLPLRRFGPAAVYRC